MKVIVYGREKLYGLGYDLIFKRIYSNKEESRNLMRDIFHEEIEIYNMDIETYKNLKEIENMEMSFELATSMIKYEAEDKRKLEGKLEEVKNMLTLEIDISTIIKIIGFNESQIMDY